MTAALAVVGLSLGVAPGLASANTVEEQMADEILADHNVERVAHGLDPIAPAVWLEAPALAQSFAMADSGSLFHSDLGNLIAHGGVWWAGENVLYMPFTADQATPLWMDSPGHRANILSTNPTHLAVAVVCVGTRAYVTTQFVDNPDSPSVVPEFIGRRNPRCGDADPASIADIEYTASENGLWAVDRDGEIYTRGDAVDHGSAPTLASDENVVSMSVTPAGAGYWLFTDKGRVFARGDAAHKGDMAGVTLAGPVIDSVAMPDGNGYYMVASDGGVFAFGSARFWGSMGGLELNRPVNGLAPTPSGKGYWLIASDGGVFAFGDATFSGSMGGTSLNSPVVSMVPYGDSYLLVGHDGGIFNFSSAAFHGSLGGASTDSGIVAVAVRDNGSGYYMVSADGELYGFGASAGG
ncbi:MAG: CAP domain-containing protein [Actinomycetia bacterium]|nr:CAP domain-containing protein [Actinomycetes bacterium]